MESFLLSIHSNEDIDLIENLEEREEAQEAFEDEIETVYQYLKKNNQVFDFHFVGYNKQLYSF